MTWDLTTQLSRCFYRRTMAVRRRYMYRKMISHFLTILQRHNLANLVSFAIALLHVSDEMIFVSVTNVPDISSCGDMAEE